MGLQHLYIPISPLQLEDMQASVSFRNFTFTWSIMCNTIRGETSISCRCHCAQATCCIFRNIQVTTNFSRQDPTHQYFRQYGSILVHYRLFLFVTTVWCKLVNYVFFLLVAFFIDLVKTWSFYILILYSYQLKFSLEWIYFLIMMTLILSSWLFVV